MNAKGKNVYLNQWRRFLHQCDSLPKMGSLVEMEVKYVFSLIKQMCEQIPTDKPWQAPQAQEWDRITFSQFLEKHCWTKEARDFVAIFMGCCTSCETYESSLLWTLWFTKQCDGLDVMFNIEDAAQDSKIVGGTLQLSEKLREQISGEERVLLNKTVVHIVMNKSLVSNTIEEGDHNRNNNRQLSAQADNGFTEETLIVTTLDGTQFYTRYIIMAIPISLQQKIHFSPSLPPLYNQMMQKIPMGSVIKCVVYYKEAFWRRDNLTGSMLINLPYEQGPISYTLDDTKPDGTYPAIVGFIIGDRAKLMLEKSRQERLRIICDSYAKALGSEKALKVHTHTYIQIYTYPYMLTHHIYLQPIHYEEKNWMSEQYSGGCFTAFGMPGFITNYGELLRRPLMKDRIYLAGTETATYWSGYMDGAMQAGERAAVQVMKRLGVNVNSETLVQPGVNHELIKKKKSLQIMVKERRTLGASVTDQLSLTLSINQLLTWSGILVALVGLIIMSTF